MKTPPSRSCRDDAVCGAATPNRPKIGLALSCGGARGLAHVGVIQVLEKAGIPIAMVAGSSMGAYVGALWCAGYTARDLTEFAAEIQRPRDMLRRLDFRFPPVRGLVRGLGIKRRLQDALHSATFGDLDRPLRVIAANLDTFERRVFTEGDVATAVHASLAIPGICEPVEIDGERYADGGIIDPLPVGELKRAGCDRVIAVTVVPSVAEVKHPHFSQAEGGFPFSWRKLLGRVNASVNVFAPGNVVDVLRRGIYTAQIRMSETSARKAELVIRPDIGRCPWHDYHHFASYIELGREAAQMALPAIRSLLAPAPHPAVSIPDTLISNSHELPTPDRLAALA